MLSLIYKSLAVAMIIVEEGSNLEHPKNRILVKCEMHDIHFKGKLRCVTKLD